MASGPTSGFYFPSGRARAAESRGFAIGRRHADVLRRSAIGGGSGSGLALGVIGVGTGPGEPQIKQPRHRGHVALSWISSISRSRVVIKHVCANLLP